jgi:tetratricopeptide (TPR) repeat protein
MQYFHTLNVQKQGDASLMRQSVIATTKHCCKSISLSDLKPIFLKDMMVPNVHCGRYLLCRTVAPSIIIIGVTAYVEDLNGDIEELSLYHFQQSLIDDPNTWLPSGTILIIKEPYLKFGSQNQSVSLRCDSPSDIIFVDECNEKLLKGTNWFQKCTINLDVLKEKANNYYSSKDYENALKFYDRALKISPDHPVILLNKYLLF